jgi:hypothetical protein
VNFIGFSAKQGGFMANSAAMDDNKNLLLKKHVAAVHSAAPLTLLQRKIANVLLYHAYPNLMTKEEHVIRISVLSELAGYNSRDLKTIKAALKKLAGTSVEWCVIGKQPNMDSWKTSGLLADAEVVGSICLYSYSGKMRGLLSNPLMYAVIDLKVQACFRSTYGLALYENCIRFEKIPGGAQTPWIDINDFRHLMGVPDEKYDKVNDFKKRVIRAAVSEVNEVSPINVKVEYREDAGKLSAIKFHIEKKIISTEQDERPHVRHLLEHQEVRGGSLLHNLQASFGLTQKAAKKLIDKYGEEQIVAKSKLISDSASFKTGKIDNLAGYFTRALEENYQETPVTAKEAYLIEKTENDKNAVEIRKKYDKYVQQSVYESCLSCDEKERRVLMKQFSGYLSSGRGAIYQGLYDDEGINNQLVLLEFVKFLRQINHVFIQQLKSFKEFSAESIVMS